MNHNDWSFGWAAIIVGFIVLRALFGFLRNLGKAKSGSQMDRINAAAKRVLEEKQTGRTSVPVTQTKSGIGTATTAKQRPIRATATKAKPRPVRNAAMAQKPGSAVAALAKTRSPAVVRTGLSGAKEPVIQRRR